jgi:hypothetical protein
MQDKLAEQELQNRLNLIETMIAEGRQSCESWGWTFILWGIAYYVAIGWSTWGHSSYAWPVTMIAAALLTAIVASRTSEPGPETTIGRAIGAIWITVGVGMFLFCLCESLSHRLDLQTFVAAVSAMLGTANAACSMILRWKVQFVCALAWWASAASVPFCSENHTQAVFLTAIFLCQIVFGAYMMLSEARERKALAGKSGAAHA